MKRLISILALVAPLALAATASAQGDKAKTPLIVAVVDGAKLTNTAKAMKAAQEEAEKTIRELRDSLKSSFDKEMGAKDQGESGFAKELEGKVNAETQAINAGFEKNKQEVVDLLLRHVTTVHLDVSEALRQSLITKKELGTA